MKKWCWIGILLCSLALATSAGQEYSNYHYKESPDASYVDDVHYDKELNVIVVHVHARAFFINVDQTYGIRVNDNTDIDKKIASIMGETPSIVRLEKTK